MGVLKVGGETGKIMEWWLRGFPIVGKCRGWGFVTAYDRLLKDIRYLGMPRINPTERWKFFCRGIGMKWRRWKKKLEKVILPVSFGNRMAVKWKLCLE